jgi:hypothetical protein
MDTVRTWNQVVVGIDPGMTTGLAWAEGVRSAGTSYQEWWDGAYKTSKTIHAFGLGPDFVHDVAIEFMLTIMDLWSDAGSLMVVCEDFLLRPGPLLSLNRELLSPSIIGTVLQHELYSLFSAEEPGGRRWKMARELPSTTKNVITDDRLKRYGTWNGLTPHERDAWRCVLTGLRKFHGSFMAAA